MSKAIRHRLDDAERRLKSERSLQVIIVRGGLPGDPTFATVGAEQLDRATDESFSAFEARVVAAAIRAGQELLIIGGLPNGPFPPEDSA